MDTRTSPLQATILRPEEGRPIKPFGLDKRPIPLPHSYKTVYDVIVIGGGPGGSTAATLLAKGGRSVLMIEKQKFPRYHIGESFVPAVMPILAELGVLDEIKGYGFTDKYGITLIWGQQRERWSVAFSEGVGGESLGCALQVVRSEFDYILMQNARRNGVTVLEDTVVHDVVFSGDRCTGVTIHDGAGSKVEIGATFVVDASGQANLIGRKKLEIEVVKGLTNRAVWAYYQNGTVASGREAGNIIIENNISDGWLWMIPLHDGTHSVGLVAPQDAFKGRDAGQMLEEQIAVSEQVKGYLASASRVSDFRAHKDWSYSCSRFQGPGYMLVGDAAGFVDPLFSTGVFLAMNAASSCAKTLLAAFEHPDLEAELGAEYEKSYRDFLGVVTNFVTFFYDAKKNKEQYFHQAQQLVDPLATMFAREDFVYLVSGLGGLHTVMGMNPLEAIQKLTRQLERTETQNTHARQLAGQAE